MDINKEDAAILLISLTNSIELYKQVLEDDESMQNDIILYQALLENSIRLKDDLEKEILTDEPIRPPSW